MPLPRGLNLAAFLIAVQKVENAMAKQIAAEALEQARGISAGPYSSYRLRQMGHPYARRRPRPPMDPAILNVQSGRLLRGWKMRVYRTGAKVAIDLTNRAPYAPYLFRGTRRMIQRPTLERLANRFRKDYGKLLSIRTFIR